MGAVDKNDWLLRVTPGDTVLRLIGGEVPMHLLVDAVSEDQIHCGPWAFCRKTGAEIDEELGWGPAYGHTGSFLVEEKTEGEHGGTS